MKKNIKKLLGSLVATGLTASATISTIACNGVKETAVQLLSKAITNALNSDSTVFYNGSNSADVINKIKFVIKNTSILSEENYKLSEAKVIFKEDGNANEFSGLLQLNKKYNFKVEINHQNNEEKLKKVVEGSSTVIVPKKAENTKELLDTFDVKNIDNFTNLDGLLADSNIDQNEIKNKIQMGIKLQWFNFADQKIEIITSDADLKVTEDKKLGHSIKFKLIDKDSKTSKEFEIKFKYIIHERSKDLSKLKQNFIKKKISLNFGDDRKILFSGVKSILNAEILKAIREFANDKAIELSTDFEIKYYKEKIAETEWKENLMLADDVKNLFAFVQSKNSSKILVHNKNQILIINIEKSKN